MPPVGRIFMGETLPGAIVCGSNAFFGNEL